MLGTSVMKNLSKCTVNTVNATEFNKDYNVFCDAEQAVVAK